VPLCGTRKKSESKNISINFLKVCFCSGGFAAPNRRLLDRKLIFDFFRPFDLIPKYKEICEASRAEGEASKQTSSPRNNESFVWSQLLDEARTYFEQNPD